MERRTCREESLARMRAWWEGADLGRPAMFVEAPRPDAEVKWPEPPPTVEERWTNVEWQVACYEAQVASRAYFAEAVPYVFVNQGPSCPAAYLGCPRVFRPDTIWQEPIIEDWESFEPRFDRENRWWRLVVELTERAVEQAGGRYGVCVTDLGGVSDILAYMRGTERLLLDLVDNPEAVWRLRDFVAEVYREMCGELSAITMSGFPGCFGWLNIWAPGRTCSLQEDFSCMISAPRFRELCIPELRVLTDYLEYPAYHLDGPRAVQHLEALLELPNLKVVQWEPGAGEPDPLHPQWRFLIRQITEAGKISYCRCVPEQVIPFLEEMPYERMYLHCRASSPEEAERLLQEVEKVCG